MAANKIDANRCFIAVPCFNEGERLEAEPFLHLAAKVGAVIFVDDGSSDDTAAILSELAQRMPARIQVLHLDSNCGKGEAVRLGMRHGLSKGAAAVGYLDADLSTSIDDMLSMLDYFCDVGAEAVLGSRVMLLGRDIRRRPARHYLGRVFATFASQILNLPVYDTQCGAKLFRASGVLECALSEPFVSRWAFDVELLGRLLCPSNVLEAGLTASDLIEYPLNAWADVSGSKLEPWTMAGAAVDLAKIFVALRGRRTRPNRG